MTYCVVLIVICHLLGGRWMMSDAHMIVVWCMRVTDCVLKAGHATSDPWTCYGSLGKGSFMISLNIQSAVCVLLWCDVGGHHHQISAWKAKFVICMKSTSFWRFLNVEVRCEISGCWRLSRQVGRLLRKSEGSSSRNIKALRLDKLVVWVCPTSVTEQEPSS